MRPPAAADETVLVVDDDPGMRETLVEILKANGISAEGAPSAAEAIARAATLRAAAVLVDQRLPDASGIDLCEQLKAADPDLRAILLTGYATLETAIAAVGHLDEFLTKPVAPDQLIRVVRGALERRRLSRENIALVQQLTRANADLEHSVVERGRELQGLTDLAESVSSSTGMAEVTRAVAAGARAVLGASGAAVYLSGDHDTLVLAAADGPVDFPGRLPAGRAGEEVLTGHHAVVTQLVLSGQRLGLLGLVGARTARRQLLSTIASQGALAIQNAQRLSRERETVERLEELSRLKSAFLASVSHELRTPLAALTGFSEVLESRWNELPSADVQHILGRMVAQGGRLRRLIENLLDSTSLETGALRVHLAPTALAPVITRIVESYDGPSPTRLELAPDLPLVSADEDRLEQVLVNLLDNACRHGGEAADPVVLHAARAGADQVEVSVSDFGPGIDPGLLPRIFEPFTQGSDPSQHAGGVGLGLHIARGIVEAMGGSIGVESRPGSGTRFWFRLPLAC